MLANVLTGACIADPFAHKQKDHLCDFNRVRSPFLRNDEGASGRLHSLEMFCVAWRHPSRPKRDTLIDQNDQVTVREQCDFG